MRMIFLAAAFAALSVSASAQDAAPQRIERGALLPHSEPGPDPRLLRGTSYRTTQRGGWWCEVLVVQ